MDGSTGGPPDASTAVAPDDFSTGVAPVCRDFTTGASVAPDGQTGDHSRVDSSDGVGLFDVPTLCSDGRADVLSDAKWSEDDDTADARSAKSDVTPARWSDAKTDRPPDGSHDAKWSDRSTDDKSDRPPDETPGVSDVFPDATWSIRSTDDKSDRPPDVSPDAVWSDQSTVSM